MKVYDNVCDLIGNTPLVRLNNIEEYLQINNRIYAKIEKFNPGGSSKDRPAYQIIKEAIEKEKIDKNTTVIEATSGNMGIGLAMVCASYGIKLIIVMSESVTIERIKILKMYGAQVVLTPKEEGIIGAIEKAKELNSEIPNSYYINQFYNFENPYSHFLTTGQEILDCLDNDVDAVVVGMGSGGTITGLGKKVKNACNKVQIIGIEPNSAKFYSKREIANGDIPGIGSTFMPGVIDLNVVDEIITIKKSEALEMQKLLARKEGLLVGISSGAVLAGAIKYLKENNKMKNKRIVLLLPDSGERYLSIL